MLTAIVGVNWGDEGKGRMVDLLSNDYDIICRYQGGNNAGHTVINDKGTFKLNLIPSGIFRENAINVMGVGMVIDLKHLHGEVAKLRDKGIRITPDNLKISDKAHIVLPYHVLLDCLEEDRLANKKFGSTKRGIAPVYSDKYSKKGIRIGDLMYLDKIEDKIRDIVEWKNLTVNKAYGNERIDADSVISWLHEYGDPIKQYICDTTSYLNSAIKSGKNVMFEAQLGALRDVDYGIYPYTSSSNALASYAPIGAGVPWEKIDKSIGIIKAYSTCVGEGPFVCELFGNEAEKLRNAGNEYGAATGRPRRVGGFDAVASRYGTMVQGATELALTKLDILSYLEKIPVCTAYEINGKITHSFPFGYNLDKAKPVYEYLEGFNTDISKARKLSDLPVEAINYIKFIEESVNCKVSYISVGPERESFIKV